MANIPWLADRLREDGFIPVVEHDGWKKRTRPGEFRPVGVLLHHAAGAKASDANPAPSMNTVINGRGGDQPLPGPLYNVLIDYQGNCHVIAAGRTNNAGTAKASGPAPAGDGNAIYVGISMDYDGKQKPSKLQYANAINVAAAVLSKLGQPASWCRCHKETSIRGKIDPANTWTPAQWRSMVKAWMAHRWGGPSAGSGGLSATLAASLEQLRAEILENGPANMEPQEDAGSNLNSAPGVLSIDRGNT
ncbi:MAG: N-acetylmuramoyl-L-alanine amidase [Sporichthyaceae bacterium]